ncbi:MAG: glycosyltransferase family 2 protein [Lachnospiraceae bacterium]|nr:glycosyltransferase family 2 protein [Lachnospiraceae bacterium]
MKKVSVIIPCYNAEMFLPRLFDSLSNQTIGMDDLEIICVNDASTDGTYERLLEFEQQYPESVMVINLSENSKQGAARNVGIAYASSDYVGFVDSDDYIEYDMYEKLYAKAKEYDLDMAGGIVLHHENGQKCRKPNHLVTGKLMEITDARGRMEMILHGNGGGIVSKIFRRKMLTENNLFFPERTYYEDNYWLPIVCLYINRYYVLDEIVYHYVDRGISTVNQRNEKAMEDRLNMEVQKLHAYVQRGFFKEYYPGIEALFCRSYYIDTLCSMYAVWGEVSMSFYEEMKKEMISLFPHCLENQMLLARDREFLKTAFEELSQEQLHKRLLAYAYSKNK